MSKGTWMLSVALGLGLVLGGLGGVARADETMRCPTGRIVRIGDRLLELAQICGEPDRTDRRSLWREIGSRIGRADRQDHESVVVEVRIEEWLYDLGRDRLVRRLVFENGRLTRIDTLGRGRR